MKIAETLIMIVMVSTLQLNGSMLFSNKILKNIILGARILEFSLIFIDQTNRSLILNFIKIKMNNVMLSTIEKSKNLAIMLTGTEA